MATMSKSQKATYDKMVAAGDQVHAEAMRVAIEGPDAPAADASQPANPDAPPRTPEEVVHDIFRAINAHLGNKADIEALLEELHPKDAPAKP